MMGKMVMIGNGELNWMLKKALGNITIVNGLYVLVDGSELIGHRLSSRMASQTYILNIKLLS